MEQHLFTVTIRQVIDTSVQLSASSPERALQLATNIAAGEHITHTVTGIKTDVSPIVGSVKRVPR